LDAGPPIHDPFVGDAGDAPRPQAQPSARSAWAFRLGIASLALGPIAALPALVLGILGLRQARAAQGLGHDASKSVFRSYLGIVAGVSWMFASALGVAGLWLLGGHGISGDRSALAPIALPVPQPAHAATPDAPRFGTVPQKTWDRLIGKLHVVTVGVQETSLVSALKRETATADAIGSEVLLMTTRSGCEPCDALEASLGEDLMQEALERTRLVIVDVDVYGDDLDGLGIDHSVLAGFFLLTSSMTPRDAIHGGEWGEDIAENIVPVLGPFVRGTFDRRKADYRTARRFPPTEAPRRVPPPRRVQPTAPASPAPRGVWL